MVTHIKVTTVIPSKKLSYGYLIGEEAVVSEKAGLIYISPQDTTAIADAIKTQRPDPRRFEVGLPSEYFDGVEIERGVE